MFERTRRSFLALQGSWETQRHDLTSVRAISFFFCSFFFLSDWFFSPQRQSYSGLSPICHVLHFQRRVTQKWCERVFLGFTKKFSAFLDSKKVAQWHFPWFHTIFITHDVFIELPLTPLITLTGVACLCAQHVAVCSRRALQRSLKTQCRIHPNAAIHQDISIFLLLCTLTVLQGFAAVYLQAGSTAWSGQGTIHSHT